MRFVRLLTVLNIQSVIVYNTLTKTQTNNLGASNEQPNEFWKYHSNQTLVAACWINLVDLFELCQRGHRDGFLA